MITILEQIKKIAESNSCNQEDEKFIEIILHKLGFEEAVVVIGIVYLEGKGTIANPPTSVNQVAKSILKSIENQQEII